MAEKGTCDRGHEPICDHGRGDHLHGTSRRQWSKDRSLVGAALAITGLVMGLELAGGMISGSLALLSDSFHMFTHFLSLGLALGAMFVATIPRNVRRTFGLFRAEVIAALINGIGLIPLAIFILYEAYERSLDPSAVDVGTMLPLALVGLVANLSAAAILLKAERRDVNLKGAIAHMMADTISSVAVIAVGILLIFTDLLWIDAIVSAAIAVLILVWSAGLIRDTLRVLLELTPKGLDLEEVKAAAGSIDGVKDLHDVHAWEITSGMICLTAHIDVDPNVTDVDEYTDLIARMRDLMRDRFGIIHTVFEICAE